MEIRRATRADCQRIAEIQVEGWKAAYRGIVPDAHLDGLDPGRRVPVWEGFAREGTGVLLIASMEERVIGFCHLIPSRDPDAEQAAEIAAIYIEPTRWRMGAGRMLCAEALRSASQQCYRWLTLWVLSENIQGRRFYEAMGFQSDGAVKRETVRGIVLEEVRYRMELENLDRQSASCK